jgi:beta-N-acetylhexosaminidase
MRVAKTITAVLGLLAALALLPFALDWRSPVLCTVRPLAFAGLIIISASVLLLEVLILGSERDGGRTVKVTASAGLIAAASVVVTVLFLEARFLYVKHRVTTAEPQILRKLGRHIILGYRDSAEIRDLIGRGAAAGVFLGAVNVKGMSRADIARLTASFQRIRKERGLPRLWIATDQEGGIVSRLSPPLTRLPPLSDIVSGSAGDDLQKAVRQYAKTQGTELASVGVNLNLAPVADINHGIRNPDDRYSKIYRRAISSDPELTARVVRWYCSSLEHAGVRCTLKHFPGLGGVFGDTHGGTALLDTSLAQLIATDLIPFRSLMEKGDAFVMLSHAIMTAVDRDNPVSESKAVIAGLVREKWKFDGVLITDNVTMLAVYRSRLGIGEGCVAALNAGVDLILISWDPDRYYPVMDALIRAYREGRLNASALERSERRLKRTSAFPGG